MCYSDLVFWNVSKNNFADDSYNFLFVSDLFSDAIVDVSLWKMVLDGSDVLFIAIAENSEPALACWQSQSLGELFVELIASVVVPFSDGKTDEELRVSFVGKVGVSITYFSLLSIGR